MANITESDHWSLLRANYCNVVLRPRLESRDFSFFSLNGCCSLNCFIPEVHLLWICRCGNWKHLKPYNRFCRIYMIVKFSLDGFWPSLTEIQNNNATLHIPMRHRKVANFQRHFKWSFSRLYIHKHGLIYFSKQSVFVTKYSVSRSFRFFVPC